MQRFLTKVQLVDGDPPQDTEWYRNFKKKWGESRHSLHDGLYALLGRSVEQNICGYIQVVQNLEPEVPPYNRRVDYSWVDLSDEEATALLLAYS